MKLAKITEIFGEEDPLLDDPKVQALLLLVEKMAEEIESLKQELRLLKGQSTKPNFSANTPGVKEKKPWADKKKTLFVPALKSEVKPQVYLSIRKLP